MTTVRPARIVGLAEFWHETNSFSALQTDRAAFSDPTGAWLRGGAEMDNRLASNCPMGGFVSGCLSCGFEVIPVVDVFATPSGTITRDTFEALRDEIVDGLLAIDRLDAILLSLHGAAQADGHSDPEGEIVTQLDAARPDLPIVIVLDHHAGVSETLVRSSDVVIGYKTEPHVDMSACGEKAAIVAGRILAGEIDQIDRCFVRLPMVLPIENLLTIQGPLAGLMEHAQSLESSDDVVDISLFPGFPFTDKPSMASSVLVQTTGEPELARELAIELANEFWAARRAFWVDLPTPEDAVEAALQSEKTPVALVDKADHPGAGGVGDGSFLLRLLAKKGATDTVVAPLHDPPSVALAAEVGVGNVGRFRIGGLYTGAPFETDGRVRVIADGTYDALGPMDHGARLTIGRTAVIEVGGIEVVVCEGRSGLYDPEILRRLGIEPTRRRILCMKNLGTFRAAFDDIVGEVILVDAEGAAPQHLERLGHRHLIRPIEPYDSDLTFDAVAAAVSLPPRRDYQTARGE